MGMLLQYPWCGGTTQRQTGPTDRHAPRPDGGARPPVGYKVRDRGLLGVVGQRFPDYQGESTAHSPSHTPRADERTRADYVCSTGTRVGTVATDTRRGSRPSTVAGRGQRSRTDPARQTCRCSRFCARLAMPCVLLFRNPLFGARRIAEL